MIQAQDMTATLQLLRSHSLTSVVYQTIESMILQGDLQPGQHVNENALAEKLSISRGPVREALRALEQAGLVKLVARRGVFVQEVSLKEALDAYEVRASLFGTAGHILAKIITDKQLKTLKSLANEMDLLKLDGNVEDYYPINLEFHNLLVTYSRNDELAQIYQGLVKKLHLFRRKALITAGGLQASAREHLQILKALTQRDPEAAKKRMEGHVLAGKKRFIQTNQGIYLSEQGVAADED